MSLRVMAVLWLVLGVAIWNGFFDLYVSRGAREYLQLLREYELGRGPEPDMDAVMARNQHAGLIGATTWAVLVVGAGIGTMWLVARKFRVSNKL